MQVKNKLAGNWLDARKEVGMELEAEPSSVRLDLFFIFRKGELVVGIP